MDYSTLEGGLHRMLDRLHAVAETYENDAANIWRHAPN